MPPLLPLLSLVLFLQLGSPPAGNSAVALDIYRQETDLLNLGLDRVILRSFPVWDQTAPSGLRVARPGEILDDSTPVLILHLWATWCDPCKDEFPLWRELGERLRDQHEGRVHVFHIAMQNQADDMPSFVKQLRGKMPGGRLYFDRNGRLARNLGQAFDNKSLPGLPLTLWLDPERAVRRVIIGSISRRVAEVVGATARLMRLLREQEAARRQPKPHDDDIDVFSN